MGSVGLVHAREEEDPQDVQRQGLTLRRSWRHDAAGAVRKEHDEAATRQTLQEAGEALIAGMKDGSIRKRDGERFKPSVIRGYQAALEGRIYADLGACGWPRSAAPIYRTRSSGYRPPSSTLRRFVTR